MSIDKSGTPLPAKLDILVAIDAWRAAHPTATLAEIEAALAERLAALRRQMRQATIVKSEQADWSAQAPQQRPRCPSCDVALQPRGKRARHLRAAGGDITLERTYGICPVGKQGFSPPR